MKRLKTLLFSLLAMLVFIFSGCKNTEVKTVPQEPVKVGLSWDMDYEKEIPEDTIAYIESVKKAGGIPILLPKITDEKQAKEELKKVDAIILMGGHDVNPASYGEKPHKNLEELSLERDKSDFLLLKEALKEDYPVLGTCRGMQVLNIVFGGTLYQDLPTEYITRINHRDPKLEDFTYHDCEIIDKNSKLYQMLKEKDLVVNSWHHQGIERAGEGLKITAKSPDGMIEGLEVENVTFVVGVQFHPEWHVYDGDDKYLPIFTTLLEYGAKNREKR